MPDHATKCFMQGWPNAKVDCEAFGCYWISRFNRRHFVYQIQSAHLIPVPEKTDFSCRNKKLLTGDEVYEYQKLTRELIHQDFDCDSIIKERIQRAINLFDPR